MSTFPKSPKDDVDGLLYFGRMLDKIQLRARGELAEEYYANMGRATAADGAMCNFLRLDYHKVRERGLAGGTDEEILEWCYENGRRPNKGDLVVWNGFISKLGWNDFATPTLTRWKKHHGIADRSDIATMSDLFDFEGGRRS
jgi:hypothetical protein